MLPTCFLGSARKGHVNPMNKTLPMTLIAIALLAVAATPTASACVYQGTALGEGETVNYVLPCAGNHAANDAVALVEAVVAAVIEFVSGIPLPPPF